MINSFNNHTKKTAKLLCIKIYIYERKIIQYDNDV